MVKIKGSLAVCHLENLVSQLRACNNRVVRKGVPAKKCLPARPLIIRLRSLCNALPCGQRLCRHAGSERKLVPVGLIENEHLCRFGGRVQLPFMVFPDAARFHEKFYIRVPFLRGDILVEIHQRDFLVKRKGSILITLEDIGHIRRADFHVCGVPQGIFKIGDGAHALGVDDNALLTPDSVVELGDQLVKCGGECTVIVMPDFDACWIFGGQTVSVCPAAACEQKCGGSAEHI